MYSKILESFEGNMQKELDWDRSTYILSIKKRSSGSSIKFPDSFYPSQKIFVEEECKIFRYSYHNNGQVEKVQLNVLSFPNNKQYNWSNNFNDNELVLEKGEVDKKLYSSKISSKRQRLRRTNEHVLNTTKVSLHETVEDHQYDFDVLLLLFTIFHTVAFRLA